MLGCDFGDVDIFVEGSLFGVELGFGRGMFNVFFSFLYYGLCVDGGNFMFLFIMVFGFIDVIVKLGFGDIDMSLVGGIFVGFL